MLMYGSANTRMSGIPVSTGNVPPQTHDSDAASPDSGPRQRGQTTSKPPHFIGLAAASRRDTAVPLTGDGFVITLSLDRVGVIDRCRFRRIQHLEVRLEIHQLRSDA